MTYVRLLKAFRPKVFAMENVSGLVKGKMLETTFVAIMGALRDAGYRVARRLLVLAAWLARGGYESRLRWMPVLAMAPARPRQPPAIHFE